MAKVGQVIENVLTGEVIEFLTTMRETDFQMLRFRMRVNKGQSVVHHSHPIETETITVVFGQMKINLDGKDHILNAGEKVIITPGVKHVWWNITDGQLEFIEELSPSLHWETIFETLYGLSRDGKTDRGGVPNAFQVAVSLVYYPLHIDFAQAPIGLQRAIIPVLAVIGRLLGYKPYYDKYTPDALPMDKARWLIST